MVSDSLRLSWRSRDRRFDIEGFLVRPPDYDPARRYPLMVNLHGGPGSTYKNDFARINLQAGFWPSQVFANLGFLVLLPNPRGDYGYSAEFRNALRGRWGCEYELDVEPAVDRLIQDGHVDAQRLALVGHSYGAYLASVALTRTQRYKAASLSDGMVDLIALHGETWPEFSEHDQFWFGGDVLVQQERYLRQSPILAAGRIRTPTLIRAGNLRAGVKIYGHFRQMKELFAALRIQDVPTMLIVHNQEGHGISDPDTYYDYLDRNIGWLQYWVLSKGDNPLVGEWRPAAPTDRDLRAAAEGCR